MLEVVLKRKGVDSTAYATAYIFMRPLELMAALNLAGNVYVVGCLMALGYAWTVYFSLPAPVHPFSLIALLEGSIFILAGISAIHRKESQLTTLLGVLWLFLAGFDLFYAMNWKLSQWQALNNWWPSLMCIVAFVLVGGMQRKRA